MHFCQTTRPITKFGTLTFIFPPDSGNFTVVPPELSAKNFKMENQRHKFNKKFFQENQR